jgi:hypothetical protein
MSTDPHQARNPHLYIYSTRPRTRGARFWHRAESSRDGAQPCGVRVAQGRDEPGRTVLAFLRFRTWLRSLGGVLGIWRGPLEPLVGRAGGRAGRACPGWRAGPVGWPWASEPAAFGTTRLAGLQSEIHVNLDRELPVRPGVWKLDVIPYVVGSTPNVQSHGLPAPPVC